MSDSHMNCECSVSTTQLRLGVERCTECGKLAGASALVPFGTPVMKRARPIARAKRVAA